MKRGIISVPKMRRSLAILKHEKEKATYLKHKYLNGNIDENDRDKKRNNDFLIEQPLKVYIFHLNKKTFMFLHLTSRMYKVQIIVRKKKVDTLVKKDAFMIHS